MQNESQTTLPNVLSSDHLSSDHLSDFQDEEEDDAFQDQLLRCCCLPLPLLEPLLSTES